jgi:hypothetical protein
LTGKGAPCSAPVESKIWGGQIGFSGLDPLGGVPDDAANTAIEDWSVET